MNATQRPKPPSHLVLTAVLTGSLTCILSLIYIVLCTVALIFRYNCNTIEVDTLKGSEHLVATLYRVYIQDSECSTSLTVENLTSDHNVFVLTCITLCASVACLVAAAVLIGAVLSESAYQYVCIVVYGYIGVTIASIVVDLTFGVHFGIDYGYLTSELNNSSAGISVNYTIDVIRISAFLLMTLTLKGYICHLISLVLLVLLTIYAVQYSKILDQYEHSIHKLGVIKAFGAKDPRQSIQPRCENCQSNMSVSNRGSQHNLGFLNDEEPTLTRENSRRDRDDFSTPGFDRSYSWQQAPPPPGRPFSYLGDGNKRPAPAPPRVPSEPQWQRGPWAGPPVPVPDYSPTAPRRLKSALKSAYM